MFRDVGIEEQQKAGKQGRC